MAATAPLSPFVIIWHTKAVASSEGTYPSYRAALTVV